MSGECAVCCEPFTLHTRKRIDCGWCSYAACASCAQRFILTLNDTPHCMSCNHAWDRQFMQLNFTKAFTTNTLKKHREQVLFEIEKGLLPETQPYAEREREALDLEDKCSAVRKELYQVNKNARSVVMWPITRDVIEVQMHTNIAIHTLKEKIKYYERAAAMTRQDYNLNTAVDTSTERRTFIKPCPAEDCRGFLSTGWKCGLCSTKVCAKCHEIKSTDENAPEHECKPENIATVEALAKDSKPCPKCGSLIQKIEGCSQMFHTPLSGACGGGENTSLYDCKLSVDELL